MKRILIISALVLACSVCKAQEGGVAMPFLKIGQNPAVVSTGGAHLASLSSGGLFSNPAMMPFSGEKGNVSLGWNGWQVDESNYLNLSGGMCFKKRFSITLGASYGLKSPYEVVSGIGSVSEYFRPSDYLFGVGAGVRFGKHLAFGLNLKYAGQTLFEDAKIGTVAIDIFASTHFKDFSITLGINDLGGKVAVQKNSSTKSSLPSSIDLGLGWNHTMAKVHNIEILCDAGYCFHKELHLGVGAAYSWNNMVSARCGYHYGKLIPSYASVGIGGCLKGVRLDLAYLFGSRILKNSFAVSLGYSF
ncbi:MAG: PorV/PorQ family protein [Candidatus Cryptobacteroides sp.]